MRSVMFMTAIFAGMIWKPEFKFGEPLDNIIAAGLVMFVILDLVELFIRLKTR